MGILPDISHHHSLFIVYYFSLLVNPVNFYKKFLVGGDAFGCVLRHIEHIIKVGGEDVIAFGSDFDGIPETEGLEGCEKMPSLIDYLSAHIGARATRKICFDNFARVFKEVSG